MNDVRKDYRELKDRTAKFIDQYDHLAELVYAPEEYAKRRGALADRKRQLETQEFSLVVIGEMKHGKSTFLNAMLRKPVFPKDIVEATAAVTFLKHNATIAQEHPDWQDKAVVEFNDNRIIVVDHLDLCKYTTCFSKKEIDVAREVRKVTIYSDSKFVEDGVSVVDTPGMNTPNVMHEQITRDQIDRSHAAVFLFKATELGKKTDYEFLETTSKKIDRFFFVLNRIDEAGGIEESPRLIDNLRAKAEENTSLGPLLAKARFYPTSGLLALLARYGEYFPNEKFQSRQDWERCCNPPDRREALMAASGMDVFEKDLLDFLFKGERTRDFLKAHLTFITGAAEEANRYLKEKKGVLADKIDLAELEEKEKRLQLEFEREKDKVESASSDLTKKLAEAMKSFVKECETEAETRVGDFRGRVEEIQDYDVMRMQWEDFQNEIAKTVSRFASRVQIDMKDTAQSVFNAIDFKVRGELNRRLGKAKLFEMPTVEPPKIEWVVPAAVAKEVEDELAKINTELNDVEAKLAQANGNENELRMALEKKQDLERERRERLEDARAKMQMLGTRPGVERKMVRPEHDEREWRGGLFGLILTPFIGKKTVHYEAEYEEDDSAQKRFDEEKKKLDEQEAKFREEIRQRIADAGRALSAAQKAAAEAEQLRKLQDKKEQKERELRKSLREQQAKAKERAVGKMRSDLINALDGQLTEIIDITRQMSSACASWADDYIGGIQAELSTAVASRKDELEELQKTVALKKKDREVVMKRISDAETQYKFVMAEATALASDVDMMAF